MKRGTQQKIVEMSGFSKGLISLLLSGKKRPSWDTAKILGNVTGTSPVIWMDGTPDEIKKAIRKSGKIRHA